MSRSGEAIAPETSFSVGDKGNEVGAKETERLDAPQDTPPGTKRGCPLRAAGRHTWMRAISRNLREQSKTIPPQRGSFVSESWTATAESSSVARKSCLPKSPSA